MNITVATAKGSRSYQEDTLINVQMSQGTLLGVFDGHGGDEASQWMSHYFEKNFNDQRDPEAGLRQAFAVAAAMLRGYGSGTTASVAFIPTDSQDVYTAVIGDSPIIIKTPTGVWHSPEHNVRTNLAEREAARSRGGQYSGGYIFKSISGQGLQMSRALGDAELYPVVSSDPEFKMVTAAGNGFVLIGTDGLFDPGHHNFKEAAKGVLGLLTLDASAQLLVDSAVALPTHDNVTAILVRF